MLIKNTTKKALLAENAKPCRNIFLKSLGLMFSKKITSLIFAFEKEKIIPLHMFFVFFPIDVLFLDAKRKVVDMKQNFEPWTAYYSPKKSRYVIEAAAGIIARTKTRLGDLIKF